MSPLMASALTNLTQAGPRLIELFHAGSAVSIADQQCAESSQGDCWQSAEKVITIHEITRSNTKAHEKENVSYSRYFVLFRVPSWIV
jgi:hypothetical protein